MAAFRGVTPCLSCSHGSTGEMGSHHLNRKRGVRIQRPRAEAIFKFERITSFTGFSCSLISAGNCSLSCCSCGTFFSASQRPGPWRIQWPRTLPFVFASATSSCQDLWSAAISSLASASLCRSKCKVASSLPLLLLKLSIQFRHSSIRPGAMRSTSSTERASARAPFDATLTTRTFQSAWPSSIKQTAPRGWHSTTSPTRTGSILKSKTSSGSSSPGAP
mmetsp:Transcript_22612/g.40830  ORF Transcript_22612/g.40830 Transcript_22612/m.40830 type:complete len:219 (-) Transcript_22612:517-1173(-)